MDEKKRVIVLVVIALVLASIAVSVCLSDSKLVSTSTSGNVIKEDLKSGEIAIEVVPYSGIEDKLAGGNSP